MGGGGGGGFFALDGGGGGGAFFSVPPAFGAAQLAARDMTLPRALPVEDAVSGLGGDLSRRLLLALEGA